MKSFNPQNYVGCVEFNVLKLKSFLLLEEVKEFASRAIVKSNKSLVWTLAAKVFLDKKVFSQIR